MPRDFSALLREEAALLFDGALGTMFYQRGIYLNRCFDELNLTAPDMVQSLHDDYVRAGVDVIETNTFGANRAKLTPHGLGEKVRAINSAGVGLAREAAGESVLVAGAMGPLGVRIEPWGPTSLDEARELFKEQAQALLDSGVDLFILETFGDLSEIHQAILAVREVSDLPVVAQMTIDSEGNSLFGTAAETFARRLDEWEVDVLGVNCSVGPQTVLETLERMSQVTERPLSAQPNAGVPREVEGRNIYLVSPEYLAEYARRFVQAGARVVGGCCGTTPEHIRAIRGALNKLAADDRGERRGRRVSEIRIEEGAGTAPLPLAERSRLGAKLAAGEFIKTVELVPPRGHDTTRLLTRARALLEGGVDAINVPDGPRASARIGALATSLAIQQRVGIEALLHYTCRDRNLLGIQSDLLGAQALGLRNLLLVTGDPPKLGDYPDATAVFDVDAIGLCHMVERLNRGLDLGGHSLGAPTSFCFGVGINPGAVDLDYELRRFHYKVEAGAGFAITQPVFDVEVLERFLERIKDFEIPILAGIWPLLSLRNAEFMNNEVPGAHVPAPLLERMRVADERGRGREEGLRIAREILARVRPLVSGVQVAAPGGQAKSALRILDDL